MTQAEFGQQLISEIRELRNQIERSLYYLEAEELNMKPDENTWSIVQCIEHINLTNEQYIKAFRVAEKNASPAGKRNTAYRVSFIGRLLVKAQKPKEDGSIRFKMKTFDSLVPLNQKDPKARLVESVVFEKFNQDCTELERLIQSTEDYNWNSIKVKTLLGNLFKLKLGDAFAFAIAHTERHVEQAMKLYRQMQ